MFGDLKSELSLLETGDFSDFIITCGNSTWNVHRCVISRQSEFLKKLCSGSFREAKERKVELPDDDEASVGALIKYLYTLDYEDPSTPLTLHINTFILADKWGVKHLVECAKGKFETCIEGKVDINDLVAAARIAYDAGILTAKFRTMISNHAADTMSSGADFQQLLLADPQVSIDIAVALKNHQEDNSGPELYACPVCGYKLQFSFSVGNTSHYCKKCYMTSK